ncbi:uncharacterized protein PV09_05279 [Verruconis gallopava]|uniref:Cytochrome P450 n=1 Tax=Verruconis gallopava TaxID=253628 RepID=A0A0D2AWL1_9PEZI|nr:uncharacterized protein PV09_05279 [Verruconis gallopava]KIW03514.1 hypothetical protein PV09_05279 [Verruconis gallopava]
MHAIMRELLFLSRLRVVYATYSTTRSPLREVKLDEHSRLYSICTGLASSLPLSIRIVLALVASCVLVLACTRAYTAIRYRRAVARFTAPGSPSSKPAPPSLPPQIPYTIPFLGNARSFLAPRPGLFWNWLFSFHPRAAGACTLRLGPRSAHILHSPATVQALFKSRDANRLEFNIQIARTSLGVPQADIQKYHGTDAKDRRLKFESEEVDPIHVAEKINLDTLLKTDAVTELTSEFIKQFTKQLDGLDVSQEFGLVKWLRDYMFEASGRALMGEKIFEYYPDFGKDFWEFERNMLSLFFGLPEFMVPEAVRARDTSIKGIEKWHEGLARDSIDTIVDSSNSNIPWEPNHGSRANRARQEMYNKFGLSTKAKSGFDLGFTFGLASNAIPATGWMLLHILDPNADRSLKPRVMAELKAAQHPDGSLNLPVLFALPLLQSIFHEVLRLYTDVLVSRVLEKDHVLPLSGEGDRKVFLPKGTLAMAPSWPGQRDPAIWDGEKPSTEFYHERFLTTDPETGKDVFTTSGTAGRFFPFGGGKSICPGRVFAKQEIFAATALMLLNFDFEVKRCIDEHGNQTEKLPHLRDGFGGSGIVLQAGDMVVKLTRKT